MCVCGKQEGEDRPFSVAEVIEVPHEVYTCNPVSYLMAYDLRSIDVETFLRF